jgi:hypothetical protein
MEPRVIGKDLRDGCVGATRFQMGNPVEKRMFRRFDNDRTIVFRIVLIPALIGGGIGT